MVYVVYWFFQYTVFIVYCSFLIYGIYYILRCYILGSATKNNSGLDTLCIDCDKSKLGGLGGLRWLRTNRSSAALTRDEGSAIPEWRWWGIRVFQEKVSTWPVIRTPFESSLTSSPRNRCIECPDPAKSIGNCFSMKNYAGAVLRKSFQLELVAEIGPL